MPVQWMAVWCGTALDSLCGWPCGAGRHWVRCARDCISIQYVFMERFRSYAWAPVHCTRAKCIMIKHPRACKYRAVTVVDIRLMCERLYLYTVHIHRKIPLIRVGTCALYTSKVYNDQAPTRVQIPSRYGGDGLISYECVYGTILCGRQKEEKRAAICWVICGPETPTGGQVSELDC